MIIIKNFVYINVANNDTYINMIYYKFKCNNSSLLYDLYIYVNVIRTNIYFNKISFN